LGTVPVCPARRHALRKKERKNGNLTPTFSTSLLNHGNFYNPTELPIVTVQMRIEPKHCCFYVLDEKLKPGLIGLLENVEINFTTKK
jgi:hypothetical protein